MVCNEKNCRFRFSRLMPTLALLDAAVLVAIFFIGQAAFPAMLAALWTAYALSFAHFSTVPAQVLNLHSFLGNQFCQSN